MWIWLIILLWVRRPKRLNGSMSLDLDRMMLMFGCLPQMGNILFEVHITCLLQVQSWLNKLQLHQGTRRFGRVFGISEPLIKFVISYGELSRTLCQPRRICTKDIFHWIWLAPSVMSIKKQRYMPSGYVIKPKRFGNLRPILLHYIRPIFGLSWTCLKRYWAEERSSMWPGSLWLLGAYGRDIIGFKKSNLLGPFTKSACVPRIWC